MLVVCFAGCLLWALALVVLILMVCLLALCLCCLRLPVTLWVVAL